MEKLYKIISVFVLILLFSSLASALEIKSVEIIPNDAQPNSKILINLLMKNNFDFKISNLIVKIDILNKDLPFAPLDSGTEKVIENLRTDEEVFVTFNLLVTSEALPKLYKLPLKITYTKDNKTATNDDVISVNVQSKPSIKVSTEETALIKGTAQDLNFNIVNDGISGIKFLNVKVTDETNSYNLISQSSAYVGNLDSDDTETITLKLFVRDLDNSELKIPVKLTYKDMNNKVYSEDKEFIVKVYSSDEAQNLGLIKKSNSLQIFFGFIVFIIVVLFIFYKRKK